MDLTEDHVSDSVMENVDIIFHLAACADNNYYPSSISPVDRKVNIEGTGKLIASAEKASVKKFVFISTVKAMGEGGAHFLDESSTPHPASSYGRSKLEAEKLVLDCISMPSCVLRLPIVYGCSDKGNLAKMIRAIHNGRFPPLPEVHNKRSMVHVEDVIRAAVLAAEKPKSNGQIYLVTDGETYSTRQIYNWIYNASGRPIPGWNVPLFILNTAAKLFDLLEQLFNKKFPFSSEALQKLVGSAWYNNKKICEELDFSPKHTLHESLTEIIAVVMRKNKFYF